MAEVFKKIDAFFRKGKQQQNTQAMDWHEAAYYVPSLISDEVLPIDQFDQRWNHGESLDAQARRAFLESEFASIISRFKQDATAKDLEWADWNVVPLDLDPSEVERSHLPEEVRNYFLDHFNNPDINKYQHVRTNGGSMKMWEDPKITMNLEASRIKLSTTRGIHDRSIFGHPMVRHLGRSLYSSLPSSDINYSLAVGIQSDFEPHMQRRVDTQMKEYVGANKWLVAKELTRLATDAVISRRQP